MFNKIEKDMMLFITTTTLVAVILVSCGHKTIASEDEKDNEEEVVYDNPIDSIIHSTDVDNRFEEVCQFLSSNPDFIYNSNCIGYFTYDEMDRSVLWKDCKKFRIYSIPFETNYSTQYRNIIQYKEADMNLDTSSLQDNVEGLDDLYEIKGKNGKVYYILKTKTYVYHQGAIYWESITAFSIENGRFVKEKIFHAKEKEYDNIEVNCGGQRECPLDYGNIVLIYFPDNEECNEPSIFIIAEINENDWPTGYGLKYQWDGNSFEYLGKCHYDADGIRFD